MKRHPLFIFGLVAPLMLQGCSEPLDQHEHPKLTTGKALFEFHCAGCLNNAGNGNFLAGIPANRGTQMSRSEIVSFLRGMHRTSSDMPVWKDMPSEEATKIATYLKAL